LLERTGRQRIECALLVGFSEFNARLGLALRRRGVRVLWYAPPQVWAWRPARARSLTQSSDRMALLLPFEVAPWRKAGADAHYVGHPAIEAPPAERDSLRRALGFGREEPALALLPGSRAHEVRRMLPVFLAATERLRKSRPALRARLLLARASLPAEVATWATRAARGAGIDVLSGARRLAAFDVALATSGTATLECALAEVPPCIAYRTDWVAAHVVRRLLRIEHVGLPNIVLGRRAFPEHLQHAANAESLACSLDRLFAQLVPLRAACREIRGLLTTSGSPSQRVANLLRPWLC
jgi:lipid-A-disaccharide synthase